MALNIFPRQPRRESPPPSEPAPVFEAPPEPAAVPAPDAEAAPVRRATRSRRGSRAGAGARAQAIEAAPVAPEVAPPAEEPAPLAPDAPRRRSRSRARKPDESTETTATAVAAPNGVSATPGAVIDSAALIRAIEQQGRQIEALTRTLQEGLQNIARPGAQTARVGIFVDVANVELGADRARVRFDWGKVLRLLTRDRTLARAVAYAPVHDDPQVSRETQRFVEPFLDHGYKIITKPLKRFADGTIKANVDIELALDVVNMLDRLDVVCLVTGDGDFEPLVRAAQERGVRVEVAAMSNSCAANLRNAADSFIDLLARVSELRS